MKISTYHKAKGDSIVLARGSQVDLSDKPDKVYISVIYKKNKPLADNIKAQYPEV